MIPSNISREHLVQAMQEIDKNGVPEDRAVTKFYVRHNGKHYPPKYLISIANRYANGKELEPGTFSGEDETNPFLTDRGFEVILIPESEKGFDDRLKLYLEKVYPNVKVDKVKRSWLRLRDSSTLLYVNGSRKHEANNEGWYDLELKIYNELVPDSSEGPRYYAVILGSPDTTFVLPKEKVIDIFHGQQTVQSDPDAKKKARWMFAVFQRNGNYILRLNRSEAIEHDIQSYLNNWKQISDFKEEVHQNEPAIFVTGYDAKNLEISKRNNILGWKNNSKFLSEGSLVFVFNKSTLKIETGFRIKSKSNVSSNTTLIWADEIESQKLIYKNRWNAEVIYDDLNIPLKEISTIEPFNLEPFQGLLRGNFPMPLNTPGNRQKYSNFRQFLVNKTEYTANHWIFIATDRPELGLSADEIYRKRMSDKFWGLNKGTPFRKLLKKGDRAIFCHGAKKFIGSASLDSDSFELDDEQREKFSHGVRLYKTEYGIRLTDIHQWKNAKEVAGFLDYLSFVKNKEQYPTYFQGGIKQISKHEYDAIVIGSIPTITASPLPQSGSQMREFDDMALPFPDQSVIDDAINEINEELLVDQNIVMQVVVSLISGRHILLAGPVGTGKTTLARIVSELFWKDSENNENGYYADIHTATAEWSSQDVIGGIMPRIQNGSPTYEIVLGCVSETVSRNWSNSNPQRRSAHSINNKVYRGVWLVIDEFNRADIDKAFGQLFTALETKILKVPTHEGKSAFREVRIPQDYRIIGTLNTADKHYLFKLSDALKRRFAYIELPAPSRQQRDAEIYYALKNALRDMNNNSDYRDLVVLDDNLKVIDLNKSNSVFVESVNQAYDVIDFIRTIKPLGTAVLKSIYQTMLVGCKVIGDFKKAFDVSINSNLIPQVENLSVTSLQTIQNFFFGNALSFFQEKYSSNQREQYASDFKSFLFFIQAKNPETRAREFLVQKIDDNGWTSIKESFDQNSRQIDSPLFNTALQDLIRTSIQ